MTPFPWPAWYLVTSYLTFHTDLLTVFWLSGLYCGIHFCVKYISPITLQSHLANSYSSLILLLENLHLPSQTALGTPLMIQISSMLLPVEHWSSRVIINYLFNYVSLIHMHIHIHYSHCAVNLLRRWTMSYLFSVQLAPSTVWGT